MYGHPYMIDVEDCDARLPSSDQPDDSYIAELMRLSLILGRVQKTIYGCVCNIFEQRPILTDFV